jgi:hypothetical protein
MLNCGAVGQVSKMTPQQEKAFCVLRCEVSKSVITVQREFRERIKKALFLCGASIITLEFVLKDGT